MYMDILRKKSISIFPGHGFDSLKLKVRFHSTYVPTLFFFYLIIILFDLITAVRHTKLQKTFSEL